MSRRFSSWCVLSPSEAYLVSMYTRSRSSPSIHSLERAKRKFTKTVDNGQCTWSAGAVAPCVSAGILCCWPRCCSITEWLLLDLANDKDADIVGQIWYISNCMALLPAVAAANYAMETTKLSFAQWMCWYTVLLQFFWSILTLQPP
jgi:hypothetical protein